jgi:hypothetical protein
MSGQRCTVDALLAAVALAQRRPVILLTSDPDDLARLTEEPGRRKRERVAVVKLKPTAASRWLFDVPGGRGGVAAGGDD